MLQHVNYSLKFLVGVAGVHCNLPFFASLSHCRLVLAAACSLQFIIPHLYMLVDWCSVAASALQFPIPRLSLPVDWCCVAACALHLPIFNSFLLSIGVGWQRLCCKFQLITSLNRVALDNRACTAGFHFQVTSLHRTHQLKHQTKRQPKRQPSLSESNAESITQSNTQPKNPLLHQVKHPINHQLR